MFNRHSSGESGSHLDQYKLEFSAHFSNEDRCLEALDQRLTKSESPSCHICGGTDLRRSYGSRFGYCMHCKRKVGTKAAALLAGLHSAKPLLFVIWLAERGESITAAQLEKLMSIPRSTAKRALQRFKQTDTVSVQTANQTSFDPPTRMAQETLLDEPLTLIEKTEHNAIDHIQSKNAGDDFILEVAKTRVLESITNEPISFEELCRRCELKVGRLGTVLTMLELDNMVVRLPGDRFARKDSTATAGRSPNAEKSHKRSSQAGMTQKLSKNFITLIIHIPRDGAQNVDVVPFPDEQVK